MDGTAQEGTSHCQGMRVACHSHRGCVAVLACCSGALMAGDGMVVLLLPGDAKLLSAGLCTLPHVDVAVGVPQPICDHAICQLAVAHAQAGSGALQVVGDVAHALHPPSYHNLVDTCHRTWLHRTASARSSSASLQTLSAGSVEGLKLKLS